MINWIKRIFKREPTHIHLHLHGRIEHHHKVEGITFPTADKVGQTVNSPTVTHPIGESKGYCGPMELHVLEPEVNFGDEVK